MRSYVIKAFPYSEADISGYKKVLQYDEAAIEADVLRLTNKYITWSEGFPLSEGDMARCALSSELPKFRRTGVNLTVGAKLFDAELEQMLVGKYTGEKFGFKKDGVPVEVEILSVRNKNMPEPADDMVMELNIPGVSTLDEYRAYLREEQTEKMFNEDMHEPYVAVEREVLAKSDILLHKEDWDLYICLRLNQLRMISKMQGLVLEDMTEDEFKGRIPVKTYDGLIALLQKESWGVCRFSLLGRKLSESDGYGVNEDEYAQHITELAREYGITEEECREMTPYELYELNSYAGHYHGCVTEWLRNNLYI